MGIVFQKDKRSGLTYAYENHPYWDKEKKQGRSHRTLVGRVDENGNIVPTDGRGRRSPDGLRMTRRHAHVPIDQIRRSFFGATYLFDEIGREIGMTEDLKSCFPLCWKKILSIAYFLILDNNGSLMHFPRWSDCYSHPYGQSISSQRSSELFASIQEEDMRSFFRLQARRRAEKEYWAYDSTSFSSYSEALEQVKYGKNKEHDQLPQLNLLLLFGEKSGLPFYYRKISGNIPDVATVRTLLEEFDLLKLGKVKLVMDRGFYSEENINRLFKDHDKFIIGAKCSLKYVQEHIIGWKDSIREFGNYDSNTKVYFKSETISWQYSQERPYKKDVLRERRRLYLHVYFDPQKAVDDEITLNGRMNQLRVELESGQLKKSHKGLYERYFMVSKGRGGKVLVQPNNEAIEKLGETHGYFALISNEVKDPMQALLIYRTKDVVEKAFGNIKERLNCRRQRVSSEESLNGKVFVEFIALIIISYINRKMQQKKLYEKYTMTEFLGELNSIQSYCEPGRAPIIGEVLQYQKDLYDALDVKPPMK